MRDIAFKTFLTAMLICASLVLTIIWSGPHDSDPETLLKFVGTTFVIGLASALFWLAVHIKDVCQRYLNSTSQ